MSEELPLDIRYEGERVEGEDNGISSMYFRCNADPALHLLAIDRGATDVTGYLPEELIATGMITLMDLVAPESREELRYNIQQGIGEGKAFASWFVLQRKDASTAQAFMQGRANISQQFQLIDIEGYISASAIIKEEFTVDAYETSETQQAFIPLSTIDVESGFLQLLNYATESLGLLNESDEIEYSTPALRALAGMNLDYHQLFTSLFSPESISLIEKTLREVRQTGKEIKEVQVFLKRKGKVTAVNLSLSPAGSHSSHILFQIKEKSEQKIPEELNTLFSFLKNPEIRGNPRDIAKCEGLLASILSLYDPLCIAPNGEQIAMNAYLGNVIGKYREKSEDPAIKYEYNCDFWLICDREIAQACGTIIVELITNSLYHAGHEEPKIAVEMHQDQRKGKYLLSVASTGSGIFHRDNEQGSGITVVREIAAPLYGVVEVAYTEQSAQVTVSFPFECKFT